MAHKYDMKTVFNHILPFVIEHLDLLLVEDIWKDVVANKDVMKAVVYRQFQDNQKLLESKQDLKGYNERLEKHLENIPCRQNACRQCCGIYCYCKSCKPLPGKVKAKVVSYFEVHMQ